MPSKAGPEAKEKFVKAASRYFLHLVRFLRDEYLKKSIAHDLSNEYARRRNNLP